MMLLLLPMHHAVRETALEYIDIYSTVFRGDLGLYVKWETVLPNRLCVLSNVVVIVLLIFLISRFPYCAVITYRLMRVMLTER